MALVVCKICRRAFINSPHGEEACPECTIKMHEIYPVVRNFLRDNAKTVYTLYDVNRILGIDLNSLKGLITLGLIGTDTKETVCETFPESELKPLKMRPLDPEEAKKTKESMNKAKSSMHVYHKKTGKSSQKGHSGGKEQT